MKLSRRKFVGALGAGFAASAIPFDVWLKKQARASGIMTRYSTSSVEGKKMLKIYAKAVQLMQGKWAGDPHSWTFQWYTHWTPGDSASYESKREVIEKLYGPGPSPDKSLAQDMWNTCQGHGGANNPENQEQYFLVWHRMYVFYLEQIVRNVTGVPTFTLPYWPYDEPDKRSIPIEFRSPANNSNPLYRQDRNTKPSNPQNNINNGGSMDLYGALNFRCMEQKSFFPVSGSAQEGFNAMLNGNPHGQVHDDVGTGTNMGFVPTAAGDPVFWMHHSQVDRLWESWNAAGGKNPTDQAFLNKTFVFDDGNGNRVVAKNGDFLDIEKLGYRYDTLMNIPRVGAPELLSSSDASKMVMMAGTKMDEMPMGNHEKMLKGAAAQDVIHLRKTPVKIELKNTNKTTTPAPMLLKSAPANQKIFLIVSGIFASTPPGTSFSVYLNLPEDVKPTSSSPYYVGVINFFNATAMPGMGDMQMTDDFVFDVTETIKFLNNEGTPLSDISVTVEPNSDLNADSKPYIGSIEIVIE